MFIGSWQPGVLQEGLQHWLNSCLLALAMWATRGRELGMPRGQEGLGALKWGMQQDGGRSQGHRYRGCWDLVRRRLEQLCLVPIPLTDIPSDHYRSIKHPGNALGSLVPLGNEAKAVRKFCSFPSLLDMFIHLLHKTDIKN